MFEAVVTPEIVPFDGTFDAPRARCAPPEDAAGKKQLKARLADCIEELSELQRILYAHDRHAVLLVFQALDAAGKDSTIRAVMSGVNPAGCQVFSFKRPSELELDHDFLWRCAIRLPERGRIGIFNRSYYEEVLAVRVHPAYLDAQRLPEAIDRERLWQHRFESIRSFEQHLARNGTVVIKFWLNVSKDEQLRRFLARIDEPHKNWKFSAADVAERDHWDDYQQAFGEALRETSAPWAPWYAIPADDKPYMRWRVAHIVVETLKRLGLEYPQVDAEKRREIKEMRALLSKQLG